MSTLTKAQQRAYKEALERNWVTNYKHRLSTLEALAKMGLIEYRSYMFTGSKAMYGYTLPFHKSN